MEIGLDNESVTSQDIVLVHQAGNAVPSDDIEIVLDNGNGTVTVRPNQTGDLADGQWTAGERLTIPVDATSVCGGGERVSVSIAYTTKTQRFIVATKPVPITREGFTIEGGSVVPNSGYSAEATVLGTGVTDGAGGPKIDIRFDVQIGNNSNDPWPGNVNNNGNPRSHTFTDQPAEAALSVSASADTNGVYISHRTRTLTDTDGWVYVLRDGDTPPNIAGFGAQDAAATYVTPYLDTSGDLSLADNEAIFLFELGNSQTGGAATSRMSSCSSRFRRNERQSTSERPLQMNGPLSAQIRRGWHRNHPIVQKYTISLSQ